MALSLVCCSLCWPVVSHAQTNSHGHLAPGPSGPVAAQGRIVPSGEIIRIAAAPVASGAAIVDQILVKTGDTVAAGQLLAILHGHDLLQAQVTAAERDVAAATAALTEAQAAQTHGAVELQLQLADLAGRASVAEANLRRAVQDSQAALEQTQREAAAAQTALDHAKQAQQSGQMASTASVTLAQAQLDGVPRLGASERKIAAAQLDEAKAAKLNSDNQLAAQLDQAQAQVDLDGLHTRQAQAELVVEPAPDEGSLAPVQAEARAAHAAVEAEHKLLDAEQAESTASVTEAQARVDSANAALAVAHAQLALSEVHAPSAGTILSVQTQPGEAVGPNGLLQMGDLTQIFVDASVLVDDIPGVHIGQKAQIFGSALPADGLSGQVTSISSLVGGNTLINPDPTAFSDTDQKVLLVKVQLDSAAHAASLINGQVTVQFAP
jgi:HlyD family secretion protein